MSEENAEPDWICLVCGHQFNDDEASYHPAPHCPRCGSKIILPSRGKL